MISHFGYLDLNGKVVVVTAVIAAIKAKFKCYNARESKKACQLRQKKPRKLTKTEFAHI